MQIHELNKRTLNEVNMLGAGGLADRAKTTAKTLATQTGAGAALGKAITPGMNQGATDTNKFVQSDWMDLYRATQMNQATQSWINGLLKQWKIQARKLSQNSTTTVSAPTPEPTASPVEEPMYLGGKKLDPKNPKDAEIIKKIQAQNITESDERGMNPDTWKKQFVAWTDNMLKTRARNTGAEINMDMVRRDPEAQKHLPQLLSAAVEARGTRAFDDAFRQYMQAATAGIYKLTQIENNQVPGSQASTAQYQASAPSSSQLPDNLTRLFRSMGVSNPTQSTVEQLARFLKSDGIRGVGDTGSPSLDALFKRMGLS